MLISIKRCTNCMLIKFHFYRGLNVPTSWICRQLWFLCKTQAYFLSDRECSYVFIFFLLALFCIKQMRFSVCQSRQVFPRYNSSPVLDDKTLPAIHIMQLQFECSGFHVFALHKHKAEITGRVINVNNLFSVQKHWESALSLGLLSLRSLTPEMAIRSPCLTFCVIHALKFYHHLCIELAYFFLFTKMYLLKIWFLLLCLHLEASRNRTPYPLIFVPVVNQSHS